MSSGRNTSEPPVLADSPEVQAAARELARTVQDLERRGLLQYDRQANRYDLHPVVRGYAAGSLGTDDRDRLGQRAVDYFTQRPQNPYEQAETLDDVRNGLQLVRTLLQIGRTPTYTAYSGELGSALLFNLDANAEVLSTAAPVLHPRLDLAVGQRRRPRRVRLRSLARRGQALEPSRPTGTALALYARHRMRIDLKTENMAELRIHLGTWQRCSPGRTALPQARNASCSNWNSPN